MYHISDDKRSKKSAELIWKGMEACLQEKSLDKLRITDIYEKSFVSRATFYRLFDVPQDVIAYECDCIYERLAEGLVNHAFSDKKEFFLYLIEKWTEQEVLIKTLVENNLINIIYDTHMKNCDLMKKVFLEDMTISDWEADYLVAMLATIIPAAVNIWYLHGKTETPEEIYQAVSKCINIIGTQLL